MLGNGLEKHIHSRTKSAEHKGFHDGTLIEKEIRFNRRIYINSNIIRKFICQMINCVIFQIVAGKFYMEIRHLGDLWAFIRYNKYRINLVENYVIVALIFTMDHRN